MENTWHGMERRVRVVLLFVVGDTHCWEHSYTHIHSHTQILGTTQYGTYTQWSVDCQWQVHTVERGEGGGAHGRTLWQFQWLEHGLYARHTDTQTDCFKAHVDSVYICEHTNARWE